MSDWPSRVIRVRGARVNNLRDLDVDIPRDRLVVLTGVSGSGKSTLAFDTLFAEGQRRFLETLSMFARQHLEQLEPPDVDLIEGLPPTVAIDQRPGAPSPRSTVATITEILDYLRLLFARLGTPHCPRCARPIRRQTFEQMMSIVMSEPEGRKLMILAPLVRGRKGEHAGAFAAIRRAGLIRARVDGAILEVVDKPPVLARTREHQIEAVVDRLVVRDGIQPRLAESLQRALQLGEGTLVISSQVDEHWNDQMLSARMACPDCGVGLESPEPRQFSFNSPQGACPECGGLGEVAHFDADLVIPDRNQSLAGGAVAAWEAFAPAQRRALLDDPALSAFLKRSRLTRETPLSKWSPRALEGFLRGSSTCPEWTVGLLVRLEELRAAARTERPRTALEAYRARDRCPSCEGTRFRPETRAVRFDGHELASILSWTIDKIRSYFHNMTFSGSTEPVGAPLRDEIVRRVTFLEEVGLDYLTLDRPADTLSGGELQRVRLATQLGSGLVGVCYILDEPTTGLHARDTQRLVETLVRLRDLGNTVLVVEHDEQVIQAADWAIDLGPGAGPDGGRVVAQGAPASLDPGVSITARFLQGAQADPPEAAHSGRLKASQGWILVRGARAHNLKNIDVRIPLGAIACVTGVSGSGKSTLVQDILGRAVRRHLYKAGPKPGPCRAVEGLAAIDKLIDVDQSPIGRSPRSTPASYTGAYDEIRKVFASTREAKIRGFKPNRFSFNVQGGRCEACQGQGVKRVEMQMLPDLFVPCESCDGRRFNPATLEVRYKGFSIADVLDMRVDEAVGFFEAIPGVHRALVPLQEVGLGYLSLGQSSTTLSGGEAQRVKLAAELGRPQSGRALYLLDEPTAGLHPADIRGLQVVLSRLADLGNTLVIIEHNLQLIRLADWVIDLGPEAGDAGGQLVAAGTPREVAHVPASKTGAYLVRYFS